MVLADSETSNAQERPWKFPSTGAASGLNRIIATATDCTKHLPLSGRQVVHPPGGPPGHVKLYRSCRKSEGGPGHFDSAMSPERRSLYGVVTVGPRPTARAGQARVRSPPKAARTSSIGEQCDGRRGPAGGHAAGALFGARAPGPLRLAFRAWGSKRRPISQITTRPPAG